MGEKAAQREAPGDGGEHRVHGMSPGRVETLAWREGLKGAAAPGSLSLAAGGRGQDPRERPGFQSAEKRVAGELGLCKRGGGKPA